MNIHLNGGRVDGLVLDSHDQHPDAFPGNMFPRRVCLDSHRNNRAVYRLVRVDPPDDGYYQLDPVNTAAARNLTSHQWRKTARQLHNGDISRIDR